MMLLNAENPVVGAYWTIIRSTSSWPQCKAMAHRSQEHSNSRKVNLQTQWAELDQESWCIYTGISQTLPNLIPLPRVNTRPIVSALVFQDPGISHPLFFLCQPWDLRRWSEELQRDNADKDGEWAEELRISR